MEVNTTPRMTEAELITLIDQAANEGWKELDLSGKGLTSLPPEIGKLVQLEKLVLGQVNGWSWINKAELVPALSTNYLSTLPSTIAHLEQLKVLDLSGNLFGEIPQVTMELHSLEKLRASKIGLKKIPKELSKLKSLTSLSVGSNYITELPECIRELTHLEKLSFYSNHITKIPDYLNELIKLKSISFSNNQIKCIPESLFTHTELQSLALDGSQISEIPKNIGKLKKLTILSLYGNQIKEIPEEIGKLAHLKRLFLANNQISKIPKNLNKLTDLIFLSLFKNQIKEIPESLSELKKLEFLDLSNNRLSTLPDSVIRLFSLTNLYLSKNQIAIVPDNISRLTNLKELYLASNQIEEFPESITSLQNLSVLHCEDNQLTYIPQSINRLTNLKELYLDSNQLSAIPESLESLSGLERLDLFNNQLPISPEILGANNNPSSPSKIFRYCQRMRGGEVRPLNEAKVMLVGQGSVGKTSLINRLLNDRYNENQCQTDGLNVLPWNIRINSKDIQLNVWDFGGQEVYHSTHQFFLTKRSLYILTCNCRTSEDENRIEYWLKLIKSFGGESPVIIVGNKCDEQPLDIQRNTLRKKSPNIKAILETSCATGEGIPELRTAIEQEVANLDDVYNLLPLSWFQVKEQLEALDKDFISYSEYLKVCFQNDVTEEADQEQLIDLLHNLGLVLNFREHPILQGTNVLNPDWVTEGIYELLSDDTLKTISKGILTHTDLTRVLDPQRYPTKRHKYLTTLMQEFELCYPLPNCTATSFLIPGLLPKDEPDDISLPNEADSDTLAFQYHYRVLPGSILSRFIVNTHEKIHQGIQWRNGVLLAYCDNGTPNKTNNPTNIARITADTEDKKIFITINGSPTTRRLFLGLIRDTFNKIHNSFASLEITECVPVPGHPNHPPLDYQELLGLEAMGERDYPIGKLRMRVNLRQLLDGYESAEARRLSQLGEFEKEDLLNRRMQAIHPEMMPPQVVVNNIVGDNNSNQSVVGSKNNTGQIQGNDNISRQSQNH